MERAQNDSRMSPDGSTPLNSATERARAMTDGDVIWWRRVQMTEAASASTAPARLAQLARLGYRPVRLAA